MISIFTNDKVVGNFRPIYYFIPVVVSFIVCMVTAYFWMTGTKEVYKYVCLTAIFNTCIQLKIAVGEYRTWMFNFELRQVYIDYAAALKSVAAMEYEHESGNAESAQS